MQTLNPLFERVLQRLGFSARPEPTLEGLRATYGAWCQRVPFDNVRKLIHVRASDNRPFPGSTAEDFFEAWLRHGTGGTCWAGAGACQALLRWLGFDAERVVATMLAALNIPPNHGSVRVHFGSERYLVDCSILHGEPLRLGEENETRIAHPGWGVSGTFSNGRWHVRWRPLHKLDGLDCRLERFGVEREEFEGFYAGTRAWSPFNYELTVRGNRGDDVTGVSFGQAVTYHADGGTTATPATWEENRRLLIERLGFSEEIVGQLPRDVPTPPPPGTQAARQQGMES